MPIKSILHRFQPAPLYVVLVLSIFYFSVQLVLSHITHALTLLMSAYHMLCNIFALAGCIVTIKHSNPTAEEQHDSQSSVDGTKLTPSATVINLEEKSLAKRKRQEQKLRNTFGWARIDILTMLIVCIILVSLSFSLIIEALQTLVHIDHQDTMHLPLPVMIFGFMGLLLNGVTYLLIGGYTLNQSSFLHVTPSGDVVLNRSISNSADVSMTTNDSQLQIKTGSDEALKNELKAAGTPIHHATKREGAVEILRDLSSTIFVIVCALIVYMADDEQHTAKFIDPVLSIFSCVLLVSLSFPYMKESCLILLQTIPDSIDIEVFERTLLTKFPEILSYHDLHIWQLSAHKSVATVHIKFHSPKLYCKIIESVQSYFHEQGITEVTIQPEFHCPSQKPSLECLVQCSKPECIAKVCCSESRTELAEVSVVKKCKKEPMAPQARHSCIITDLEARSYEQHAKQQLDSSIRRTKSSNDVVDAPQQPAHEETCRHVAQPNEESARNTAREESAVVK